MTCNAIWCKDIWYKMIESLTKSLISLDLLLIQKLLSTVRTWMQWAVIGGKYIESELDNNVQARLCNVSCYSSVSYFSSPPQYSSIYTGCIGLSTYSSNTGVIISHFHREIVISLHICVIAILSLYELCLRNIWISIFMMLCIKLVQVRRLSLFEVMKRKVFGIRISVKSVL